MKDLKNHRSHLQKKVCRAAQKDNRPQLAPPTAPHDESYQVLTPQEANQYDEAHVLQRRREPGYRRRDITSRQKQHVVDYHQRPR